MKVKKTRLADLPDVLTVPEAAAALRIGRDAAYGLVRNGELYAVRVGRSLRVPKAAVLELLSHHKGNAAETEKSETRGIPTAGPQASSQPQRERRVPRARA